MFVSRAWRGDSPPFQIEGTTKPFVPDFCARIPGAVRHPTNYPRRINAAEWSDYANQDSWVVGRVSDARGLRWRLQYHDNPAASACAYGDGYDAGERGNGCRGYICRYGYVQRGDECRDDHFVNIHIDTAGWCGSQRDGHLRIEHGNIDAEQSAGQRHAVHGNDHDWHNECVGHGFGGELLMDFYDCDCSRSDRYGSDTNERFDGCGDYIGRYGNLQYRYECCDDHFVDIYIDAAGRHCSECSG